MKNNAIMTNFFMGNEASRYGQENRRVDYATLAKSFDAVLCNDITKLFYSSVNGEYSEVEQVNGYIDNTEEIEELQNKIDELLEKITEDSTKEQDNVIYNKIEELENQIEELEEEQENNSEIYQYYIISDNGARILEDWTNEIVYYIPILDVYVWGVTHWGTSWDYVLTDIKIQLKGE